MDRSNRDLSLTEMSRQIETLRKQLERQQLQHDIETLQREIDETYIGLLALTPGRRMVDGEKLRLEGTKHLSPISRHDEMLMGEYGQPPSARTEKLASVPSQDRTILRQRGQLLCDRAPSVSHDDDETFYYGLPSSTQRQVTKCDGFAAGGSSFNPWGDNLPRSSMKKEMEERLELYEQTARRTNGLQSQDGMLDRRCQSEIGSTKQVTVPKTVHDRAANDEPSCHQQQALDYGCQGGVETKSGNRNESGQARCSLSMRPATYDGSSSWTDYKAHFEACASLNEWNEKQKGLYLSVSLRGQAQGVFGNLSASSTDYQELVKALEDRFAPPNQTELYRVQLRDRQQRATDSMAGLGQDIRRLTNLAYPSAPNDVRDTLAKEQFIDALNNSEMRLRIKQARPINLNDAVRHAVELESFYKAEKRQQGMVRYTVTDKEDCSTDMRQIQRQLDSIQRSLRSDKTPFARRADTEAGMSSSGKSLGRNQQFKQQHAMGRKERSTEKRNYRRKIRCYGCGQEGHIQRNCRQRRDENNMTESKSTQSKQSTVYKTGTMLSAGLHAKGYINGSAVNCLVDTGTTLSLISVEVWNSISSSCNIDSFNTPIMSASGNNLKVLGCSELSLKIGEQCCPMRVIVAEIDVDMVLGIDFMKEHQVNIDMCRDVMFVRGQEIPLSCTGRIGCYHVVLTEKVSVPAGTEIIGPGRVKDAKTSSLGIGLIEPSERFVELGRGLVARTLVSSKGDVPFRIANLSGETKTYYPGTQTATFSKIQSIHENQQQHVQSDQLPEDLQGLYTRATDELVVSEKTQVNVLGCAHGEGLEEETEEVVQTRSGRRRNPPVWAKDYMFSI